MAPTSPKRSFVAGLAGFAVALSGLAVVASGPAQADVSTKIATFPYTQDWSNGALITANDNWSGVLGVQGYLGQDITTVTGTDPQTLTGESALANDTDVVANAAATATNGGVVEVEGQSIAIQGSATADAPYVAFHLDLTGQSGATFSFNAKDLDAGADDATQQIAVQYRVGTSGAFTNLPTGNIPDATQPGAATLVTPKSVALPAGTDGQASVFVRVMTTNAAGNDELVGIDDVAITVGAGPAELTATDPPDVNATVGSPITTINLEATGGDDPYTWDVTGLPAGITESSDGVITGTPTTAGNSVVTATVTDSLNDTDAVEFNINVVEADDVTIAEIQGTGAASPLDGQVVTTEGEVTAAYPTGGLNGFYIQTPGADTANASDAIFVYGGPTGFANYPTIGQSVEVTGEADEFNGSTQIIASNVTVISDLPGSVTPKTQIPGTDCALPGTACLAGAALNDAREVAEGEAFQPTATWTATDIYDGSPFVTGQSFSSSNFGELGLAADSDLPLVTPTELIDAQDVAAKTARSRYNDAHRIVLDDGATTNFTSNTGLPFSWYTPTHIPRVGASVTFPAPVILNFSFGTWKVLPSTQVVGGPSATQPQFEQTRAADAAPQDVGGDIKLATFNVLNFFPTTGNEYVTLGLGSCTYFTDRQGNQITNNNCSPNGPRGAANEVNLTRQRDKIVSAINTVDADIVSLEELENSVHFNKPRDFAIDALVTALNADAGAGTWAAVPSPSAANLPPLSEQDVIRNGFIYKPANVALVGDSVVLADQSTGTEAFADAREPLAQAFKKVGSANSQAFAVIVNHFKSKGSGTPDPDGQGNANDRRELQAAALVTFADQFKTLRGITRVFLAGDFNAYTEEDPIQILNDAGYTNLESTVDPDEESYNFDGQIGSLDHVLANAPALADVEGVDIWTINGYESVYYEYSRFNYNVTNLYDPGPFKSSDHNPEVIGINVAGEPATRDIQILGTNDFHGRLVRDGAGPTAGAAVLAGAVKQLRAANPDTAFVAAGDLIGASTFESFIAKDKPTIDALNEAGLDVSAAGNHEFDQGYDDLINRVMQPYNASTNPYGGANWEYIAANIRKNVDNTHALAPTWTQDFGSVKVGYVGAVTEHLPELVSPAGIASIHVTDIVTEVNAAANDLKAGGADVIVLLVHEGAPSTNCATMDDDPTSDFGSIITGVNVNIDAIVSGHTHLAYDCSFVVPGWSGRPVTERPVVSAGQYGMALNKLVFTVDTATGVVQAKTQTLLNLQSCTSNCTPPATPVWTANYPADPNTAAIVSAAVSNAAVLGAQPLGQIGGPFFRGKLTNGTTENRGAESTLGNLVAEVQRWNTRNPESGSAQIAFMNPGGLRADMVGTGTGAFPRTLTYKQAADVQPFANTLVNMDLTGAQIKTVLEQQWQPGGASRPFLKLGISKGFEYTFDDTKPSGSRITGMWLNGTPIAPATVYSVTVNSFLASGGDNFLELNNGANKQDTGKIDLQGMVDYMATFGGSPNVVPVDYVQNGVGVTFPVSAPAAYAPGAHVLFNVSSWSMTNALDVKDTEVVVKLGATTLGTFPLDNAAQAALPGFDTTGKASVDVVVPALPPGVATLTLTGTNTGTEIEVPITVSEPPSLSGVVRNQDDVPLAGVCVYLYTSESAPSASYATCTQPDGSYYIGGIVPGEYVVAVSDPNDDYETLFVEEPVDLSASVSNYDLVLTAISQGTISGTVTASNGPSAGGPVGNICVFAYEENVSSSASYATCTAANGNYGMSGVAASVDYDVAFFDPSAVYPTKWWTGTAAGSPNQAGAVAVNVTPGGTTDVDQVMSVATTGFMSGTVTDPSNNPVAGVCVYLYRNVFAAAVAATCTGADGTWWIPNLAPGVNYRVAISDPQARFRTHYYKTGTPAGAPTLFGATPLTVTAGQTTANINAKLTPVP